MRKIIALGDLHGRSQWQHCIDYLLEHDSIIFIGDYADSFKLSNDAIYDNLVKVIEFKKQYPDKVVLLIGNHDLQYIQHEHQCTGYRPEAALDLHLLYKENLHLFQMAHVESNETDTYLFTHAGVSTGWIDYYLKPGLIRLDAILGNGISAPFNSISYPSPNVLADVLNKLAEIGYWDLFHTIDSDSGGSHHFASLIWARPQKLVKWQLNCHQVFGHTHLNKKTNFTEGLSNSCICIDCLTNEMSVETFKQNLFILTL